MKQFLKLSPYQSVHVTNDVEAPHNTVTATDGNHITAVIKVSRVDSSAQIGDRSRRLEIVTTVEDLGFISHGATRHNQVTSLLLELSGVHLAGGMSGLLLTGSLESDLLAELASSEFPQLQLVDIVVATGQHKPIVHINGVTANEGSTNVADHITRAHIPHLDGLVPTAGDDQVLVVLAELRAENTQ